MSTPVSAQAPNGTGIQPQATDAAPVDPLYFARWNINYGEYLNEVGKYLEALEAFQTAIEATTNAQVQAEAHLQRASTLALFLDAFEDAAREYAHIVQDYAQTPLAETARFRLALLWFDQQRYQEAVPQFEIYLQQYPQGRFAASAEALLARSRQELQRQSPFLPAHRVPAITRPLVRVRVLKAVAQVDIRSTASLTVSSVAGDVVMQGQNRVTLQPAAGAILLAGQGNTANELRISSSAPLTLLQKTLSCQQQEPTQPASYRGALRVSVRDGKLHVVNEVDIEAYLYGVVPAEVPASWPLEALKTQAVAARTYALYQTGHRQDWRFDLVDSDGDQVYKGLLCEAERATQAVEATQGLILVYEHRPILAMYTANTGWHSAFVQDVFDQVLPYLVGVPDPYSPTQPLGRWKRTYQAPEIQRKLAQIGVQVGVVQDIIPREVTPSGRIKQAVLISTRGTQVLRARTTLRRALQLPEILLKITHKQDTFVFEGGGFGHGVGLSQWGAKAMAAAGQTAPEILQFYYHNVHLQHAW